MRLLTPATFYVFKLKTNQPIENCIFRHFTTVSLSLSLSLSLSAFFIPLTWNLFYYTYIFYRDIKSPCKVEGKSPRVNYAEVYLKTCVGVFNSSLS